MFRTGPMHFSRVYRDRVAARTGCLDEQYRPPGARSSDAAPARPTLGDAGAKSVDGEHAPKHVVSVENTVQILQAFSGNLTLLSASVGTDERATQEFYFLNQGLED